MRSIRPFSGIDVISLLPSSSSRRPSFVPMIRRALLSVSDKTGIADFARGLQKKNIDMIATDGTTKMLRAEGLPVQTIEEVTHFPECFSGRVKTIHPLITGGILFQRGDKQHEAQAKHLSIEPIDLVLVNLYPFKVTVESGATDTDVIEKIGRAHV